MSENYDQREEQYALNKKRAVSRKSECTGSAHIVYALKWFLGGHAVDAKPVKAFTIRKKANAFAKEKNKKSTQCEYVVKSLKLHE
jgi:hypothetical protein